ncbi:MAG: hypothetical protein ACRDQW_04845 [Haloechinothrix sp.]
MRQGWAGVGVLLVLALGACGQGYIPPSERPPADPVELEVLRTKVTALMTDPCHTAPTQQQPQSCEKFITQLGNTASTLTEVARAGEPDLLEPANRMERSISAYRRGGCNQDAPKSVDACVAALVHLSSAVEDGYATLGAG